MLTGIVCNIWTKSTVKGFSVHILCWEYTTVFMGHVVLKEGRLDLPLLRRCPRKHPILHIVMGSQVFIIMHCVEGHAF